MIFVRSGSLDLGSPDIS